MSEVLEIMIDGIVYRPKRRTFASGKHGFKFQAGGTVHGRRVFIQVLVIDRDDMPLNFRVHKTAQNRLRKAANKERVAAQTAAAKAVAAEWLRRRG